MTRLGDICRFQSGGTPPKNDPKNYGGNIPWITTVALNGSVIGGNNAVEWITEEAIHKSAAKIVPANSIMVGTRVGVGKVAINGIPMSTSQDIISLIDIDETKWDKKYLCKLILANNDYLNAQARGATIKGIKIDVLEGIKVPSIPVEEQRTVSAVIERIDSIISLRKKQLQKLDDLIKSRFVEMFGDENNLMIMSKICLIITDGTHQPPKFRDTGIPFIFVSNIASDKVTYGTDKFIDQDTYDELIRRTPIEVGDILLSTVGSYGHPAVVKTNQKFLFQRHIAYLKPKKELVDSDYLHSALLSPDAQRQIEEGVKGIAQKTLNLSEIKKIRIPVPSLERQKEFAAFIAQVDKSKTVVQKALDEALLLFDSLMQKHFR